MTKSMSSGSRAIAIPTNGRAHGGDSVARTPPPFGESFLNAKIHSQACCRSRQCRVRLRAPDEDDKARGGCARFEGIMSVSRSPKAVL